MDIKKNDNIIIESIKEENVEEEEITDFHQSNKNCDVPLSDELPNEKTGFKYRVSLKTTNFEQNKINEINEVNEVEDEN